MSRHQRPTRLSRPLPGSGAVSAVAPARPLDQPLGHPLGLSRDHSWARRPGRRAAPRPGGPTGGRGQRGAALLLALLTLSLVASLASAALWQQWRYAEIESAERARQQADWILRGALDWSRLILREDGRTGGADHLGEPWAIALAEARLSSFLSSGPGARDGDLTQEAFLSGQISDLQGRLNLANLLLQGRASEADQLALQRLFALRGWPEALLNTLLRQLQSTQSGAPSDASQPALLLPQRLDQLSWLGWPPALLNRMQDDLVWLPERTRVNVNTASAAVLAASVQGLTLADAQQLVGLRNRRPLNQLADFNALLPPGARPVTPASHDVRSQYFGVQGRLRLGTTVIEQASLLQRKGTDVQVLWTGHATLDTRLAATGAPP